MQVVHVPTLVIAGRAMLECLTVGEREGLVACFLFQNQMWEDKRQPAAQLQVKSVYSRTRCPLWGPTLEASWNSLLLQEARKWHTIAQCHKMLPQWHSARWRVAGCNGAPGGNWTHTAADSQPAPQATWCQRHQASQNSLGTRKRKSVGRAYLGTRPAGERTSLEGMMPSVVPGEPGNLSLPTHSPGDWESSILPYF